MTEYTEYGEYTLGVSGAEGVIIETRDFKILKEDGLKEAIEALVSEHMRANEIDTSETGGYDNDPMECQYETYSEMLLALLSNSWTISPMGIEEEIFEALVQSGYVSNGLVLQQDYYKNKYNNYYVSNSSFQRAVKTTELFVHPADLVKLLAESGQIEILGSSTVKVLQPLQSQLNVET